MTQLPSFPSTNMSHHFPTGLAAMPAAKSQCTPHFSGQDDEILTEFLREYKDLAVGNGLTEQQKVETILCYVPHSPCNLWVTLPGYWTARWYHFRSELDKLYPDIAAQTWCMQQGLAEFVELSAQSWICDENNIMKYYQNFLTITHPLLDEHKIITDAFKAEVFQSFHADDQDILVEQIFNINPRHPANEPFSVQDVLSAAQQYFTTDWFHMRLQHHVCGKLCGCSKTHCDKPEKLIQRLFGDKHSHKPTTQNDDSDSGQEDEYETHNVHFKESGKAQPKEEDDPITLIGKLKSLSVCKPSYLVLYSQCQEHFPTIAQLLPKPNLFATQTPTAVATVSYQSHHTPACQPCAQQTPANPTQPSALELDLDIFFSDRNGA